VDKLWKGVSQQLLTAGYKGSVRCENESVKTSPAAILLVLLCTLLGSAAQVLYKIGAKNLVMDPIRIASNWHLALGLMLYGISALLLVSALRRGELSVLYPIISLSYVWVSLLSIYFFGEHMTPLKWVGIGSIIAGISFIGIGTGMEKESKNQ